MEGWTYTITHIYVPANALWFILSLCFWRIFLNITPATLLYRPLWSYGASIFISFIIGFVPVDSQFSFQRTFAFYPYFLLGYYMKDNVAELKKINIVFPLGVLLAYCVIICITNIPTPMSMYQRSSYYIVGVIPGFLGKITFHLWPIPIMASIIALTLKLPRVKYFEQEGQHTLFYYYYHMFFVLFFRIMNVHWGVPCNLITVLLFCVASFAVMRLLRNIKPLVFLSNPEFKKQ